MSRFHTYLRRTLIFALAVATVWLVAPRPSFAEEDAEEGAPPARHLSGPKPGTSTSRVNVHAAGSAVVNFADLARQQAARTTGEEIIRGYKIAEETVPLEEPLEPLSGFVPTQLQSPTGVQVASPGPLNSFMGLDDIAMVDSLYIVIPPDVAGAVGPNKVMNTHNNNYRVLDKATGAVISTVGTATFWAPTGETALNGLTDPRTVYDPYNNCWIAVMQTVTANNGDILLGVSQTSDPNGAWYLYRFAIGATLDFPILGFNKNWISVTINRYNASNLFQQGINLVLDYGQARAGFGTGTLFSLPAGTGFCAAPCNTYSTTEDTLFVVTHLSSGGATYTFDWITGTPSTPAYTIGGLAKARPGGGWTQPSGNILPQSAPVSGASACGATPCKIETQDAQIRSAPAYRNGVIYYTQTVGIPAGGLTHTAAQWTKLLATGSTPANNGNFLEGGRIEDPTATATNGGKWYAYPHIAVNSVGDLLVGYSQFSSAQHPSSGYSYHDHSDGTGTMRDPVVYKTGDDYYHKTFSTTAGRNRWGDFSQAQVDPVDDGSFWTVQEYAKARTASANDGNTGANSSRWSTYWAQTIGPQSTVNIQPGPSLNEGNSGTTPFNFTVTLSSVYSLPVTVNWQTVDGAATTADNDYLPTSGVLTFPPGTSSQTITVLVVGDTKVEPNEDFKVQLTGVTNAVMGTSLSTGLIQNDDTYTITASAGAGGSISPSGAVPVFPGADQTFTITPDACFSIADVLVDGASVGAVGSYTFPAVSANHTISATFSRNVYVITASAGAGGTINPSGPVNVNCGDDQSFTIAANAGFTIGDVLVDGVSVGAVASYTFPNVMAAHTISASFNHITHTITASAGAGGSINPSGAVTVNEGDDQTFLMTADNCHTIADVLVDGVSVGAVATYTFSNVTANHTIELSLAQKIYSIAASAGPGGAISPSGAVSVNCGDDQTFTITPDACHLIADVLVDGVSVGTVATYTFTGVTANHTISASFATKVYVITASAGAGGTIAPSGLVNVNCGDDQTFTIAPNSGFSILDVVVDGVSVGAAGTYTFPAVSANHTISASFSQNTHTITASAGAGGSISPSGSVVVNEHSDQTFTITPDGCHVIGDVLVDGVSVGAVATYTFTDVAANHTISALFNPKEYSITASAGGGGAISPSGTVNVTCGNNQAFTITPDDCHTIADVLVDGVSVGAVGTYTFPAVGANHTITASFLIKFLTVHATAGAGGSISPSGDVRVDCGTSVTFTITPDACHAIGDVTVNGVSVGPVTTYTVTCNKDDLVDVGIVAVFNLTSYTINATAGTGGAISPSGAVSVSCGSNQTFTITPDACHTIANVLVDGISVGAVGTYTFPSVAANHTIAASFNLKTYILTSSAGAGGSISPNGTFVVNCGTTPTFTITASAGFAILDVKVDGVSVGAVASYTFPPISADHGIAASFYHINHPPMLSGPISQMVDEGQVLTFNIIGTDPDGDALTLSSMSIPAGSSFTDHHDNTGTFTWATTSSDGRATPYFAIFRATDPDNLTGEWSTTLFVNDITPVRLFVKNSDKTIKLMSGNPDWCVYVETTSFPLTDIIPSSVHLISPGTGSVSQIPIITGKTILVGDQDRNGTQDIRFCFSKTDLRLLFSSLTGKTTQNVAVEGQTLAGTKFRGTLTIDVQAGGGSSAVTAAISPNPLNPNTTLVYKLETPGPVRIRLYDVSGRLVRNIHESAFESAGYHQLDIEARDGSGGPLSSGVYFYAVDVKGGQAKGSMVILK